MPHTIVELGRAMLRDPVKAAVASAGSTVARAEQRIVRVDRAAKPRILADILKRESIDRALVFTRTKHGADRVVRSLVKAGISAQAIHGNKSQHQRDRALASFRKGEVRTLVATDIAARRSRGQTPPPRSTQQRKAPRGLLTSLAIIQSLIP
jgi:superfamily II DNA/RNA helicase